MSLAITVARKLRNALQKFQNSLVPRVLEQTVSISGHSEFLVKFDEEILNYTRIRIDVGLSHAAPNSAAWTHLNPDVFVVGVEASRFNVAKISKRGVWSKNNPSHPIRRFKPKNMQILHVALDDVDTPCYSEFYNMLGDSGTSSLLRPTKKLHELFGYEVGDSELVPTISFSDLLSALPWSNLDFVELVKIDAQGKDLAIIKSARNHLAQIAVLVIEVETHDQYFGAPSSSETISFLEGEGFTRVKPADQAREGGGEVDVVFVNPRHAKRVQHVLDELEGN